MLKRELTFWDSVAVTVGSVIGVGIFRVPSATAQFVSEPSLILMVWVAGGLIAFLGALCYSELASTFPETGGNYVYLKYAYGPWAAFLFGWSKLAVIRTASIASIAYVFGEYLQNFLPYGPAGVKSVALLMIWLLTALNILGLRYGKWLQNILGVCKISALVGIIIIGFASGKGDWSHFQMSAGAPNSFSLTYFALALVPVLWTYGGWHESTFVAGEFKNTRVDLPLSLLGSTILITALYLGVNVVYLYLLEPGSLAARPLIAADVMSLLFGESGKKIISGIILLNVLGVLNTVILTGGRIPFALAQDHSLFGFLKKTSQRFFTPYPALLVNAAWASLLVFGGSFDKLLFFYAAPVWFFFAMASFGIFRLRKKFPDRERPFSVWGYPVTVILFGSIASVLCINTLIHSPESFLGFVILFSGLPLYALSEWLRKRSRERVLNPPLL